MIGKTHSSHNIHLQYTQPFPYQATVGVMEKFLYCLCTIRVLYAFHFACYLCGVRVRLAYHVHFVFHFSNYTLL